MTTRKRAGILARISNPGDKRKDSINTQIIACKAVCLQYDYEVLHIIEEHYSGMAETWKRDSIKSLLKLLKNKEIDVIVCLDQDRLVREFDYTSPLLTEINKYGGCVHLVHGGIIEATLDGKFMATVKAYTFTKEVINTQERTQRCKLEKLLNGRLIAQGCVPYGYRKNDKRDGYVVFEPEAKCIRLIFMLADNGWSCRKIAIWLTQQGHPSPSASSRRNNPSKSWHAEVIKTILVRTDYIGTVIMRRYKTIDNKKIKRSSDQHIRINDACQAIIETEQWQRVQDKLKKNVGDQTRNEKNFYLLRGIAYCLRCFTKGIYNKSGNREYLRCSGKKKIVDKCPTKDLSLKKITEKAVNIFIQALTDSEAFKHIEDIENEMSEEIALLESSLQTAYTKIAELEKQHKRYMSRLIDFECDTDLDEEDKAILKEKIKNTKDEKAAFARSAKETEAHLAQTKNSIPTFPTFMQLANVPAVVFNELSANEQRQIMMAAQFKVYYADGIVVGRFPKWTVIPEGVVLPSELCGKSCQNYYRQEHLNYLFASDLQLIAA